MIRGLGYEARTKVEVFGLRRVEDTEWITWADSRGLVALVKDDAIRRRPLERRALLQSSLRVFCLTNGNLRKAEQVARFEARWDSIIRKCRTGPDPF
jgi:PIN like domain